MSDDDETIAAARNLTCPKCSAPMETIAFHDINVDRCTSCKGLWFDAIEKDHLDQLEDSASIDIGQAPATVPVARTHMNCPVCHTRMIEMADPQNPGIHFESCKVCFGLFFDAGKYRARKENQTLSLFHDLFHRKGK